MNIRGISVFAGALALSVAFSTSAQWRGKPRGGDEPKTPREQVTDVKVAAGKEITITGTAKVELAVTPVPDPIRMMIDVRDMAPAQDLPRVLDINVGIIKTIRINDFAGITRLEVTLNQDAEYIIEKAGKEATVKLEPKLKEKDDTIPPELYYKAQKASTEMIETGGITPEIHTNVTVPRSGSGARVVTMTGSGKAASSPQAEAMNPESSSYMRTATRIVDVKHRMTDSHVQILIRTNGTVGEFKEFTMKGPNRIIIDLTGVMGTVPQNSYSVSQGGVRRVRLGEHSGYTRAVIDLSGKKMPQYYVTRTRGGIMAVVALE